MKRVLCVVGSPRKNGNTHILVDRILEGAQEEGAAGELLFLGDLNVRECDGCHVCWQGRACSKNDDMNRIYPTLAESDVIVFGTPVYWYGPTALMKGFIDRFVYFGCPQNRAYVRGKPAALAIPFEEEDLEMAAPLVTFFQKSFQYLEMELAGQVLAPGVTARGEVLEHADRLEEARELGRRLAKIPRP